MDSIQFEVHGFGRDKKRKPLITTGITSGDSVTIIIKNGNHVYSFRHESLRRALRAAVNLLDKIEPMPVAMNNCRCVTIFSDKK